MKNDGLSFVNVAIIKLYLASTTVSVTRKLSCDGWGWGWGGRIIGGEVNKVGSVMQMYAEVFIKILHKNKCTTSAKIHKVLANKPQ